MRTAIWMLGCLPLTLAGCDGGNGGDAGGPDAGDVVARDCPSYCTAIMDTCTGDAMQYTDRDACLATCATIAPGTSEDTGGNTLGCRIYHIGEARELGLEHCDHAGPAGEEECGSSCEGYCTLVMAACTGGDALFASEAECTTACEAYPVEEYNASVVSGDNIACRLHFGTLAAGDPTMCPMAGPDSTACVD